jgi:hypothetical protein
MYPKYRKKLKFSLTDVGFGFRIDWGVFTLTPDDGGIIWYEVWQITFMFQFLFWRVSVTHYRYTEKERYSHEQIRQ